MMRKVLRYLAATRRRASAAFTRFAAARTAATEALTVKAVGAILAAPTLGAADEAARAGRRVRGGKPAATVASARLLVRALREADAEFASARRKVRAAKKDFRSFDLRPDLRRRSRLMAATGRPLSAILEALAGLVRADYVGAFHAFAHGRVVVRDAASAADAGVAVESREDWDVYGRDYPRPATVWTVTVRAMPFRRLASMPGGVVAPGGLPTLWAEPIPAPEGVRAAWRAVWAVRRRGIDWDVERGVMVESASGEIVHQWRAVVSDGWKDARGRRIRTRRGRLARRAHLIRQAEAAALDRAVRVAARRDRSVAPPPATEAPAPAPVDGDLRVNARHAVAAGLCRSGIRGFAARHFPSLDWRRDEVTVRRLRAAAVADGQVGLVERAIARAAAEADRRAAA